MAKRIDGSRKQTASRPNTFYSADVKALKNCLKVLGHRPLKLIAESLYKDESEWTDSAWEYKANRSGVTNKNLLLNKKNDFQFSVADQHAKQDYHIHKHTLEIYISESSISVKLNGASKPKRITGVLIIPPGMAHKVKLSGLTYVFQITRTARSVSKDKIIVDESGKNCLP